MGLSKQQKLRTQLLVPVIALASYLWLPARAAEEVGRYFRFVDHNGETVIATQVPRELVRKGYEVLNDSGRVIRVVAPQLSSEELRQQAARRKIEKLRQAQAVRQQAEDEELLRLYNTPTDVEQALARVLEDIDGRISVLEADIQRLQYQKEKKQSEAARTEKAGRAVPENLLQDMSNIAAQQQSMKQNIAELDKEKSKVKQDYQEKKQRVEFLQNGAGGTQSQNPDLSLSAAEITGSWRPASFGGQVQLFRAKSSGVFEMEKTVAGGKQTLSGTWKIKGGNTLVVLYSRSKTVRGGRTVQDAFAREERYPIFDRRGKDLLILWGDDVIRFKPVK